MKKPSPAIIYFIVYFVISLVIIRVSRIYQLNFWLQVALIVPAFYLCGRLVNRYLSKRK